MQWLFVARVVAGHSGGGRAGITPASRSLTQRKLGKNCCEVYISGAPRENDFSRGGAELRPSFEFFVEKGLVRIERDLLAADEEALHVGDDLQRIAVGDDDVGQLAGFQ